MYTAALQDAGFSGGGMDFVGEIFTSIGKIGASVAKTTATLKTTKEQARQFAIQKEMAKYFHVPGGTPDALTRALNMAATAPSEQVRSGELSPTTQKRLPGWAWALVGVGGVAVLGGAAWMLTR